jgi:signal transduction histidine kinase
VKRFSVRDVRTRLLVVVLAALAVALAASTTAFNVILTKTGAADADALLRQRADSERSLLQVSDGHLRITEHGDDRLGDSRIWIFQGTKAIERPRARPETERAAVALANGPRRYVTISATDERLLAEPVVDEGHRYGTVVAGVSMAPYERTQHIALIASVAFAIALMLLVGSAVFWLLRSALRPVAQMTAQAEAWSDNNVEGRFHLGPPHDELTRLAATLDALLDRIAASLRHERLLSAELSHELRTPLSKLRAEAELALRRPRTAREYTEALERVIADADRIQHIVEALLAAAEGESGRRGIADATTVARAAAASCRPLAEAADVHVVVNEPPRSFAIGVDAAFAERVLHPILDNACRYARCRVDVSVQRENGAVEFVVADDGPGVSPDEQEEIFAPATRGEAGRESAGGAGLGLALARRLARSVSGDVEADANADGGRFVVRLPAA